MFKHILELQNCPENIAQRGFLWEKQYYLDISEWQWIISYYYFSDLPLFTFFSDYNKKSPTFTNLLIYF